MLDDTASSLFAADMSSLGGSLRRTMNDQLRPSESDGQLIGRREPDRAPGSSGGHLIQPGKLMRHATSAGMHGDDLAQQQQEGLVGPLHGGKLEVQKQRMTIKLPTANQTGSLLPRQVERRDKKSGHEILVNARLQSEIDMLSTQLDALQREKDMQRMEISRLRNQMVKLAGLSNNPGENLPSLEDYFSSQRELTPVEQSPTAKEPRGNTSIGFDLDNLSHGSAMADKLMSREAQAGLRKTRARSRSPSNMSIRSSGGSVISISVNREK